MVIVQGPHTRLCLHTCMMDPAAKMVRGFRGSSANELPRCSNARMLSFVLCKGRQSSSRQNLSVTHGCDTLVAYVRAVPHNAATHMLPVKLSKMAT